MITKSERWNLRVTPAQDTIVRRVLSATGMSLNEYVVSRTVAAATSDLADRQIFVLEPDAWDELQEILYRPPHRIPDSPPSSHNRRRSKTSEPVPRSDAALSGPRLRLRRRDPRRLAQAPRPRNQREGPSRTWVVTDGARFVAYYASSAAVLTRADATGCGATSQQIV